MKKNNFILTPISAMLDDVASATIGTSSGIETFPLCDYVMQSVFLKMTGALEQKMKAISWEMATNDYEYRYDRYYKHPLGECSSYQEKKEIYKDLVEQICRVKNKYYDPTSIDKLLVLENTTKKIEGLFSGSSLMIWAQRSFNEYRDIWATITEKHFIHDAYNLLTNGSNLPNQTDSGKSLVDIYNKHLYRHRNRVAHNTFSYQQNLPTLDTLVNIDHKYDNYFIYFSMLMLMDEVFIKLFDEYLYSLEYH
ncbi:hypothetical protein BGP77_11050 [Saccharospirillum sp. MSK14-1]|uniref:hypothetical protein n=1 Tax=Saccharospirillum sp. MSK14-1 TaxID=1897632 RepID=UPI000D39D393|nr:hypothetical protein [Saccharospirillum sp. MSK14-1]PTY38709.1 hypothetical protein BGP77_11050 [Saccharospirillum sp. MSK14-1]